MEEDTKAPTTNINNPQLDEHNVEVDKTMKPNYDDVVLVSQPTLSSKSTLPSDTLELR